MTALMTALQRLNGAEEALGDAIQSVREAIGCPPAPISPVTGGEIPAGIAHIIEIARGITAGRTYHAGTVADHCDTITWLADRNEQLEQENGIQAGMIEQLQLQDRQLRESLSNMGPQRARLLAQVAELTTQLEEERDMDKPTNLEDLLDEFDELEVAAIHEYATAKVEDEREACAKVVDSRAVLWRSSACKDAAETIRARPSPSLPAGGAV